MALDLARKVVFPLMDGNGENIIYCDKFITYVDYLFMYLKYKLSFSALLISRSADNGGDVSPVSHDDLVQVRYFNITNRIVLTEVIIK